MLNTIIPVYLRDSAYCQIVWDETVVILAAASATAAPLLKGLFGAHEFVELMSPTWAVNSILSSAVLGLLQEGFFSKHCPLFTLLAE